MTVSVSRPFASNAVLHVTLGHVLKGVIAFKGLMIEWVVVKGYGETMDLWTESRHKVFRKVTENAHAAMLHFYSPTLPELAVRSFMVRKYEHFIFFLFGIIYIIEYTSYIKNLIDYIFFYFIDLVL